MLWSLTLPQNRKLVKINKAGQTSPKSFARIVIRKVIILLIILNPPK